MSMEKTIRRVTDPEEQQMEAYRYWQNLPVGERLTAVWEISRDAYAFAAAFRGDAAHDASKSERSITRVQAPHGAFLKKAPCAHG